MGEAGQGSGGMKTQVTDLLTGETRILTDAEIQHEEFMTATLQQSIGDCEFACCWVEPFGWVPEAGCPIHDRLENTIRIPIPGKLRTH